MIHTKTIQIETVPRFLQTWAFSNVKYRRGSSCHICTALFNQNLLTSDELEQFNALTYWGLKKRETFTQFYRDYFGKVMAKWVERATAENWLELQKWAKAELALIESGNLETAFRKFVERVVVINEEVNSSLELYNAPELNCYLGAMKSVEVAC